MSINLRDYDNIVVLTGAGVSVASGLPTYRGPGGVWTEGGDPAAATLTGFLADPLRTWSLLGPLRKVAARAQPNEAHRALAAAERRARARFTLITQNVDGLHQRAGSQEVVEVHGNIHRTRCSNVACDSAPFADEASRDDFVHPCAVCGAPLRPDVVFFGEEIPADPGWAIKMALRACDLFIAVGTSGTVSPASNYVRGAEYAGARTVYVNLEPMIPRNPAFQEEVLGRAEAILPAVLGLP